MRWHIIKAELYKTLIKVRRNNFRLFDITLWPLILFFAITLFLRFMSPSFEVLSMAITGLIGWRAVYHMQIESNIAYMEDYWSKSTAQQLASPLKIMDIITTGIIAGAIKFIVVLSMYLIIAYSMYSFRIIDLFRFTLGISYLAFVGVVLGMITFAFVILYRDKAITFSFMIPDLFVLMSGVYYPISIFPEPIIAFVHVLPTFYGFELLKSMTGLGTANYLGMFVAGIAWLFAAMAILWIAIRKAKRNGSFSDFN